MGKKTVLSLKKLVEKIETVEEERDKEYLIDYLNQEKRENLYCLNKWEDLVQDIRYDRNYGSCFENREEGFIVTDITKMKRNDKYYIFRGMLNEDKYWETFRESAENLLTNTRQKSVLEKDHAYELSLLSITMLEFDRAKFYLEKFREKFLKNWSSVKDFSSLQTKTEVMSELLRQQELKDFLYSTKHFNISGLQDSPDLSNFYDNLSNWLKRGSNSSLNNFNYLSDSYHARCLFIDIMKSRYDEYKTEDSSKHIIQVGLEYVRGLLNMGHIDTAERVINSSFKRKQDCLVDDGSLDYDFAYLMIKSRLCAIDRDINFISRLMDESNINLKFLNTRFVKINQVMNSWLSMGNLSNEFEMEAKFNLLVLKIKAKEIGAIRDYVGHTSAEAEEQYFGIVNEVMPLVDRQVKAIESKLLLGIAMDIEGDNGLVDLKMKTLKKGCEVIENILRWYKSKADSQGSNLKKLDSEDLSQNIMSNVKKLIYYTSDLVGYGFVAHSRILFVLEMTAEFSYELGDYFNECFKMVPCWIFLKWLPQIMSYLNFEAGSCFLPLVERLLLKYPEPLIYSLSVTTDYSMIFKKENSNVEKLGEILRKHFSEESTHLKFIRAMEYLLHPDQRLKSWLDCIEENGARPERLSIIRERLMEDIFTINDKLVGEAIGDFNKKFIREIEKLAFKLFGPNFSNLETMKQKELSKAVQELFSKAEVFCRAKSISHTTSSYKTKLSAFSAWISEYDINNYRRHDLRIEIPGQYSGDVEPVPELHVKISYFLPEVLVIQSIRKPKRITMLGTDEKVYHCLVKGGEDLRLDQRIEQMFSLMNEIFLKDPDCSKGEFSIGTFNVIPVKKNLGVMEWVKNTIPLKSVIEREMPPAEDILNNNAFIKRTGLLKELARGQDIREQHIALVGAKRDKVVKDFIIQLRHFKSNYLKIAIKKKVQNAEQYVKLRKAFLSNYAVLSLGSYILGVGDRHLDNFLFDHVNGKIIPIDFGYSFGLGVGLYIPELMPFRFTQNFQELVFPLGNQGIFRNSMIFALKALKENKNLLTDTCEVFIRDPLIDWIKIARSKVVGDSSQAIDLETAAYPRDKLRIVEMKLSGYSPVEVIVKELEKSRHSKQKYYGQLMQTVEGASHRKRATMREGVLPVCDQVDALIDMAIDPDILGRSWSGWAPYA